MFNILLIWLVSFAGFVNQESVFFCQQYEIVYTSSTESFHVSDTLRYESTLVQTLKNDVLMIETDRALFRFFPLDNKTYTVVDEVSETVRVKILAVIIGRPDQLYSIFETRRYTKKERSLVDYIFTVRPIPTRTGIDAPVSGLILDVSNHKEFLK